MKNTENDFTVLHIKLSKDLNLLYIQLQEKIGNSSEYHSIETFY